MTQSINASHLMWAAGMATADGLDTPDLSAGFRAPTGPSLPTGANAGWLLRLSERLMITGAIRPSSARLARAMAALAMGANHVLELGAGSGAVTAALTQVVDAQNIHAVELQPQQAQRLKRRFPELRVTQGAAATALDHCTAEGPVAVVSSLPFRSLPSAIRQSTVDSLLQFLNARPEARLIQFTYGLREPFQAGPGFQWARVGWVLANLPPASVWVLSKR